MKKIVLTGGGTAGHITPNIALMPELRRRGYEIYYVGSKKGMEKDMIEAINVPYYGVSNGKLRRNFDWKNFTDPFRVIKGCSEAKKVLKTIRPDVIFSKGGYVSVPVVIAAHSLHIPTVIHESDMTPGLANKISLRFADKVCCNFPETMQFRSCSRETDRPACSSADLPATNRSSLLSAAVSAPSLSITPSVLSCRSSHRNTM